MKNYNRYPVPIIDRVSLANKGAGFEVLEKEPISYTGTGSSHRVEVLFQQTSNKVKLIDVFSLRPTRSQFANIKL